MEAPCFSSRTFGVSSPSANRLILAFLFVLMTLMQLARASVTSSPPPLITSQFSAFPDSSSSSFIPLSPSPSPFLSVQSLSYSSSSRNSSSRYPFVESTSQSIVSTSLVVMTSPQTMPLRSTIISLDESSIFSASSGFMTGSSNLLLSSSPSLLPSSSSLPLSSSSFSFSSSPSLTSQMSTSHGAMSSSSPMATTPSYVMWSSIHGSSLLSATPSMTSPSLSPSSAINATPSYTELTPTQSLMPTTILPSPSPTMVASTTIPTAEPNELSLLEWFGIAVGCAAVFFILFLMYHCHQVRQHNIQRHKKEMKKEILHVDFSQSNHGDRVSSWRNSMALDAMTTHIELPREDTGMDMQWMENLGFEEVYLGDEQKSGNNNSLLPQTNL